MSVRNKRILYEENGILAIVTPVNENKTIEEHAKKSVPEGKKYYIVDKSEIPTDRSFRQAWTYTE